MITELSKGDPKGVLWEKVTTELARRGLSKEEVGRAIMELLDNGVIEEPQIGWLKPRTSGLLNW